jgi:glycosyltransferase involved in cell wall biosynthesis
MRVLVFTSLFPNSREPNRGCFNLQQFQALTDYAEVRVVAPIPWRPWAESGRRQVPYEAEWEGIPATYPLYFFTPRVGRMAYALWMYCSVRNTVMRVAREYRPDVLLATWAYPNAVVAAALARSLGLPWVAKVHGSDINVSAASRVNGHQIRWALRQASCTCAVSSPLKQRLIELGVPPESVRVQHNGVNVERFGIQDRLKARCVTDLPEARRIILYVGNLKVSKGVLDLLEAARLMTAEGADVPLFVFVGGGPDRNMLAEEVQRRDLGQHVLLTGPRPHSEIPNWIAAANVLCLPSHHEGCPNVVLEALACGCPVVASRVGAVPEFIDRQCGAVVAPRDPAQLAAALREVLFQDWDAAALRQRVLPLSWQANARAMAAELERAVVERGHLAPVQEKAPLTAPE